MKISEILEEVTSIYNKIEDLEIDIQNLADNAKTIRRQLEMIPSEMSDVEKEEEKDEEA